MSSHAWLRQVSGLFAAASDTPPLFPMRPEAGDLNACKRGAQPRFSGCPAAIACSPRDSNEAGGWVVGFAPQ